MRWSGRLRQADNPRSRKIYRCFPNCRPSREKDCPSPREIHTEMHSNVNARRLIAWIYAVLFIGIGTLSGVFFFRTYQEYAQYQRLEAESRQKLVQAEQKLKDQERVLERLRSDPDYVAKVIRQQLRYAKPSELIFRFED